MYINKRNNQLSFKRLFIIITCFILVVTTGLICFIKYDTSAAADFTDNVLRPLLGTKIVLFLEKTYFNATDKIQQVTTNSNNIQTPQFNSLFQDGNLVSNHLNLNPISPISSFAPLKNEGVWKTMKLASFPNQGVMAYTFVRSDKNRPYSIVTIAQIDMTSMRLGAVAGTKEPGGLAGNPGPGKVPSSIVDSNRLVAAFDGGFQYRDGQYGMIVGNQTYLPLKPDLGTLIGYDNGDIKIIDYKGQDLGSGISFIRQNCPILIENGQLSVTNVNNKKLWGRTFTSDIYTWRTGIGLTSNGNLLFAVGNNLTPTTLAYALKMAGAENAMQLDINPNWVRFNIFSPLGNGQYDSSTLTHDLKNGATSYLNGYSKDFFYLYKK